MEIKVEEKVDETTIKVEKGDMKARLEEVKREAISDVRTRALEIRKKVEKEEENFTPRLGKWFGW